MWQKPFKFTMSYYVRSGKGLDKSYGSRLWEWEIDGTDSGYCPVADFGISDTELLGSAVTRIVT